MEARAELEERRHTSTTLHAPGRRLDDAADDLEQRALARPIMADESDGASDGNVEIDVAERPEVFTVLASRARVDDALLDGLVLVQDETLGDILDLNDRGGRPWVRAPERSRPGYGRIDGAKATTGRAR